MSFIIALYVHEGLVLASDSRSTFSDSLTDATGKTIERKGVHFTDSTYKTFLSKSQVGLSICGDISINNQPITGYIESFLDEHQTDNVEQIANTLIPFFGGISPSLDSVFFIGGYIPDSAGRPQLKLFKAETLSKTVKEIDTSTQGAMWNGEIDVMSRLLTNLYIKNTTGTYIEHSRYPILWQYFSLQDAIDFARYAVQTTIDTMRFQKRIKTVGGPVDILVIKPDGAFWICRKELH